MRVFADFLFKTLSLLIVLIDFVVFILILPLFVILAFFLNRKNRLNNQYCFSYNEKSNKYYLHHSPRVIINFTDSTTFFNSRINAVDEFKLLKPNEALFAKTMTLQDFYEKMGFEGEKTKQTFGIVSSTFLAILMNLRNIIKFKTFRLFKRVYTVKPKEYKIL